VEKPRFGEAFSLSDPLLMPISHGILIPLSGINAWQTKNAWEDTMHRRKFLRSAGMGGGAAVAVGTFAAPSIAQTMPELKWRLASSFPKSLDTLYGAGEMLVKYVAEMTDNKFQIRIFAAGEIVPGLQVLDAVQNGTVEMGHTAGTYYVGKDPTFAFDTAIPFGTNSRQQDAWMNWGGGRELLGEFYKAYNVHGIVCGATGAQMGGWFRKEIRTVDDLKGLKFRIAGIAGLVINRVGGVAQQIAGGDIYPALEKGTIDAAEWVGPYDDQKLGFNKITQYYYYPGWWEGGPQPSAYINLEKWNELPKPYKAVMEAGCAQAQKWMLSKYDAENPKALRELAATGTKLMPFTQPVMEACFNASNEIWAEISAKNARFKKVYDSWRPFRNEEILWFRVCENTFDNFMARQSAADKL
jgi:TRAP-type mannitol/chloroaromatic compound transport system substrate-binding protein